MTFNWQRWLILIGGALLFLALFFGLSYCSGSNVGEATAKLEVQQKQTQQIQKETKEHVILKQEVIQLPDADLDARLDYWMRD